MASAQTDTLVRILWIDAGLGCDGDSLGPTEATRPCIEEIVLV